jgi:hypothetical protein
MINVLDTKNNLMMHYVLRDGEDRVIHNVMLTEHEAAQKNRAFGLNQSLHKYTLKKN